MHDTIIHRQWVNDGLHVFVYYRFTGDHISSYSRETHLFTVVI